MPERWTTAGPGVAGVADQVDAADQLDAAHQLDVADQVDAADQVDVRQIRPAWRSAQRVVERALAAAIHVAAGSS